MILRTRYFRIDHLPYCIYRLKPFHCIPELIDFENYTGFRKSQYVIPFFRSWKYIRRKLGIYPFYDSDLKRLTIKDRTTLKIKNNFLKAITGDREIRKFIKGALKQTRIS